jgi:hypothetical protein
MPAEPVFSEDAVPAFQTSSEDGEHILGCIDVGLHEACWTETPPAGRVDPSNVVGIVVNNATTSGSR